MKGKWHSIISVLVALAVVLGLFMAVAVPASALTAAAVTVTPTSVNSGARYTIVFTLGAGGANTLTANVDTITVTFPSGTTVPATMPANTIIVNGIVIDNVTTPAPVVTGRAVQITTPVTIAGGAVATVVFSQAAGILNPTRATTTATLRVATSAEAAVTSGAYTIFSTVTLSPTSGARGAAVTVTGAGFGTSLGVDISFAGVNIGTATTDASGNFTGTITVPSGAAGGGNAIIATDGAGTASPAATFTVNPSLTLTPNHGLPGSTVQITGSAYTASTAITATVGGAGVAVAPGGVATTATGAIPSIAGGAAANTTFVIPAGSTAGAKTVTITAGTSASATFTVDPRPITLSPTSGNVGTRVTLTGTNMPGATIATITFGAVAATIGVIPIDASGNWNALNIVVPDTTPTGAQSVVATDNLGNTASGTFTLATRSITLSPTTGTAGSQIIVNGTGFKRNGSVLVQWPAGTTRVTGTADASGNFAAAFNNPAAPAGADTTNVVTAVDSVTATIVATANFVVPGATLTVTPSSVAQGGTVTIAGQGFDTYAALATLTIGVPSVLPATGVTTDANGSFSVTVTVPGSVAVGVTTVTATTIGVAETVTFTVAAAPTTTATQLTNLGTNLVRVWGFSASAQTWSLYDPAVSAQSTLASLTRGQGYWIKVTAAQTLVAGGNSYSLSAGWNLVGWLG